MQETGTNATDISKIQKKLELAGMQPLLDLLARVSNENINNVIDIGCRNGFSTEVLKNRFPEANICGMDKSAAAIEAARKRLPDVSFSVADLSTWEDDGKYDLIFSDSVLQLVSAHATILTKLIGQLSQGGTLAIQVPDNAEQPMQEILRTISGEGPWAHKIDPVIQRMAVESADWYYQQLRDKVTRLEVWRTTYYFSAANPVEASEWYRGTDLHLYLDPLEKEEQLEFLSLYSARVNETYYPFFEGGRLLPFSRLFFIATR
ncbi:methyltransferase domain-containing protein [Chitinophaga arvensicola]|uniref:Trans-aconitate 2-methyltransferase n=1 Tax=Chitinophaga arvensicola TaxID=29529 RepID=A0A1I0SCA2_9BACT|nr:methyltransferase domain-containing protein [Chitinophaga arvensicola]SEW53381.1 trans-aconitate 2-methyltransferase [Chitinophaga arvensicola]